MPDIKLDFVDVPVANNATEVVNGGQAAARTGDAATEVVNGGQAIGAVATAADFVVAPVIGTIFYDENMKTGEKVFGEKSSPR